MESEGRNKIRQRKERKEGITDRRNEERKEQIPHSTNEEGRSGEIGKQVSKLFCRTLRMRGKFVWA